MYSVNSVKTGIFVFHYYALNLKKNIKVISFLEWFFSFNFLFIHFYYWVVKAGKRERRFFILSFLFPSGSHLNVEPLLLDPSANVNPSNRQYCNISFVRWITNFSPFLRPSVYFCQFLFFFFFRFDFLLSVKLWSRNK